MPNKTLIKTILSQHFTSYSSLRSATSMLSSHLGLNLLLVPPHHQMLCSHTLVSHSTAIKTTSTSLRIATGSSGLSHTRTPIHNPIFRAGNSEKNYVCFSNKSMYANSPQTSHFTHSLTNVTQTRLRWSSVLQITFLLSSNVSEGWQNGSALRQIRLHWRISVCLWLSISA